MEHSFADLLDDAFSDTSAPLLSDEDLDFENLNCDENLEENKSGVSHGNFTQEEDNILHQKTEEDVYMPEDVDKEHSEDENNEEDFQRVRVMEQTEEDYTSSDGDSDQESSVSGEDGEDEREDLGAGENPRDPVMSVHCGDEIHDGDKEDRIFTEGQPLAPEAAENPQVRNEEQGESGSDGEVSYFERVPERGGDVMMRGGIGIEEDKHDCEKEEEEEEEEEGENRQDSSDSERDDMKIEETEDVLTLRSEQDNESPSTVNPSLEFPEISVQRLQDLIAEVESEDYLEKVKEFSAEEHQEAGESFADYPSDFSSCEYVEDGGKRQDRAQSNVHQGSVSKRNTWMETAAAGVTWTGSQEAAEEGSEYLYSVDLEADDHRFKNVATQEKGRIDFVEHVFGDVGVTDGGEAGEKISYSSSDDEVQVKMSDKELERRIYVDDVGVGDCANGKRLMELHGGSGAAFSRWSNGADSADFNFTWNPDTLTSLLSVDQLTTERTDEAETLFSLVNPAEEDNSYLMVQRGDTKNTSSPSSQGSVDDSFFFNDELESSGGMEPGQLGDDEYEEERNWEQEKERIKAFYKFYNDSDGENEREGRQIKVQFCENLLSKVIQFDTDSSDRDSSSSSTDGEEDLSSAETSEELKEPDDSSSSLLESACEPPDTEILESEPDLTNTPVCTRKHKCLVVLKLILKMFVVIVMGLLMFWLATEEEGWFKQTPYL